MITYFIEKLIDGYKILYSYIFERNNYETPRIDYSTPYLPDDCIYNILKYLQPHRSTLFNCLLVDRFWCRITVPLLYADPFDYATNEKNSSIILTLILCFDKTEILQLKNQLKFINGGFYRYIWNLLDKVKDVDINVNDKYKPLFKYSKYLEDFDYDKINRTILFWLKISIPYSPYHPRDRYNKAYENFIPVFHQSVLRQCNHNIKRLSIPLEFLKNKSNLTKLNALHINLWHPWSYDHNVHNVQEFLSNISKLRKLKLTSYSSNYEKLACLDDIILSLDIQKYSLVAIEFNGVNFSKISFKNFMSLCNLKYLKFSNCKIPAGQCEVLKYASFELEGLYLYYDLYNRNNTYDRYNIPTNHIPIPILSMIKYLGSSLKELVLIEYLEILIIESISIYCPNLITLEINISSDIDLLVFSYLKNLKIRALNIVYSHHYNSRGGKLDEVTKCLASNLPINVKEISFHSCLCFKKFFEHYHDYNCFDIINLDISPTNTELKFLDLFKIILNFIEKDDNDLKVLGMRKLKPIWNEEELKLLNQIKAKGVKIACYYIYKYDAHFI